MSVITESLNMTPIVIIANFTCCEDGIEFEWEKSKEFNIGDIVRFVDAFEDVSCNQDHLKWMVKFQSEEGKIYSASQLYFVTVDEWNAIKKYFG